MSEDQAWALELMRELEDVQPETDPDIQGVRGLQLASGATSLPGSEITSCAKGRDLERPLKKDPRGQKCQGPIWGPFRRRHCLDQQD